MDTDIIAIYCVCDDLLGVVDSHENLAYHMSDAEVMTTGVVSALYFSGHHRLACDFLKNHGYIPAMLSYSRFNRRLHHLTGQIEQLIQVLGSYWQQTNDEQLYAVDSFPISVCDNKRIKQCRRFKGEAWRGYQASKRRYFYGMKLHLLVTEAGSPVECFLTEGAVSDVRALKQFAFDLPEKAEILGDKAYNDYAVEDVLADVNIQLSPLRKSNSKRSVPAYVSYWRQLKRKVVEITGSLLERLMPKHIHTVTSAGFEIKIMLFILALSIKAFIQ